MTDRVSRQSNSVSPSLSRRGFMLNSAAIAAGLGTSSLILPRSAMAAGLKTVDGLGMLMHQGVPAFEAFFGVRPKVTPALRETLVKVLGGR